MSITCDASGQFCPNPSLINPCGNPRTLFEKKQLLFTFNTNANSVNDVSKKKAFSYIVRNAKSSNISRKTKNALTFCAYRQNLYIIGGQNKSVERYTFDPNNKITRWDPFVNLPIVLQDLTAQYYKTNKYDYLVTLGGENNTGAKNDIITYNLNNTSEGWVQNRFDISLNYTRTNLTSNLLTVNNIKYIYVMGGVDNVPSVIYPIERYNVTGCEILDSTFDLSGNDIQNSANTTRFQYVHPRRNAGSVVYNGKIHIIGGSSRGRILSTVFYLDLENTRTNPDGSTSRWFPLGWDGDFPGGSGNDPWTTDGSDGPYAPGDYNLQTKRQGCGAAVYNGYIYVAGGSKGGTDLSCNEMTNEQPLTPIANFPLKTVEYFDGTSWKYAPCMNIPRFGCSLKNFQDKLYVVGGENGQGNSVKEIEIFDGKSWTLSSPTINKHNDSPGVISTVERA